MYYKGIRTPGLNTGSLFLAIDINLSFYREKQVITSLPSGLPSQLSHLSLPNARTRDSQGDKWFLSAPPAYLGAATPPCGQTHGYPSRKWGSDILLVLERKSTVLKQPFRDIRGNFLRMTAIGITSVKIKSTPSSLFMV